MSWSLRETRGGSECKFGGGGIIASSTELARAGAALYQGLVIPESRLAEALRPWSPVSGTVYGAAVAQIDTGTGPVQTFSLSGGAPGGRSFLLVMVEPRISVAIAGNMDGPNMADAAWELANIWRVGP